MARYGRDFDRGQMGMRGGSQGVGMGRGFGGGSQGYDEEFGGGFRGRPGSGGQYGGMGSDAFGGQRSRGFSGFGPGGGAYDSEFSGGMDRGGSMGGGMHLGSTSGRGMYGGREGGFGGGHSGGGYSAGGHGGYEGSFGGGYSDMGSTEYGRGGMAGGRSQGFGGGSGRRNSFGQQGGFGGQDELRRRRASEVMTEDPETVTADATLADAAKKMRDLDVGIIPVVESDTSRRLRGVITDRDIAIRAVAEGKDVNSTKVMEAMTTEVETCNKNDTLQDVMRVMEREQVRRVPITDREGRLVGIVAQADVATEVSGRHGMYEVADTLEHISEPGQPRRGGGGMMSRGSTSRSGGQQSGAQMGMQAGSAGNTGSTGRSGSTRSTGGSQQSGATGGRTSQNRGSTEE